jgi:hypothetical protein
LERDLIGLLLSNKQATQMADTEDGYANAIVAVNVLHLKTG